MYLKIYIVGKPSISLLISLQAETNSRTTTGVLLNISKKIKQLKLGWEATKGYTSSTNHHRGIQTEFNLFLSLHPWQLWACLLVQLGLNAELNSSLCNVISQGFLNPFLSHEKEIQKPAHFLIANPLKLFSGQLNPRLGKYSSLFILEGKREPYNQQVAG